jgi:hypothetical protein
MRSHVKASAVALVTVAAFASALWVAAGSASAADRGTCSLATIEGAYGSRQTGTLNGQPVAQLNRVVSNGKGRFVGSGTVVVDGVVTTTSFTATYTVNPDCTGTFTSSSGVTENLITKVDGSFVQFIVTSHPAGAATISGDATRLDDPQP